MPTFLVGSDEQRELLDQFQRRCLHFSEAYQKNKPLCFNARAFQKSHPEKEEEGIDDADVTLASPMLLGIADGVSQVNDLGLDASELPKELLKSCEEIATSQLISDPDDETAQETYSGPIALLKEAYAETESLGSTSVLLAVMDNSSQIHGKLHPMIGVVTLGDCELVVLRRKKGRQGPLEVVLHTEMQRIGGQAQTPLQLCRMNTHYDPGFEEDDALDAIERGSGLHCTSAYEGDMIIMGSDGVFDNLFLSEVVAICNAQLKPLKKEGTFVPAHPALLSEIAQSIVLKANSKSCDEDTPVGRGGKADDCSVVVAEVVEWTQSRREVWERSHRRRHWSSIFDFNCAMKPCDLAVCMDGSATSDSDSDEAPEPAIKCSIL